MAYSVVAIANLALMRVGVLQRIDSLDEAGATATAVNAVYDHCVAATLSDFPWPFAATSAALGLVETDPNTDWTYSYAVPSDCLNVRRVVSAAGRADANRIPFVVGYGTAGRLLFTDEPQAVLEYTINLTEPSQFDASFVDALAWRIAAEISFPLSVSDSIRSRALNEYAVAGAKAMAVALNATQPDSAPEASYITARE